jgi:hypothetical protein
VPNKITSLDAGMTLLFHVGRQRPGASELARSAAFAHHYTLHTKLNSHQTMKTFPNILWIALVATALMTVPCGCKPKTTVLASLSATVAGREIKASIDGPAFIQPQADSATITFGNHKVRVEKERLLLDDKETAKIPARATNVTVVVSNATLTVTADSTNIVTTNITR